MKGLLACLCALIVLGLPGCDDARPPAPSGQEGGADKTLPRVGVFLYKKNDVYISLVNGALGKYLEGRAELSVYCAEEKQLTQNKQIDEALGSKVDGLVINITDTQAASGVVDKAKKAGIPAVFFNRQPDLNNIKAYSKACFVGTTNDAGVMQGDMIHQLWVEHPEYDRNKDGKFQYVMFQGNPDNPEALARTELSVKRARELGVDMRQVGATNLCDWNETLAYQAMRRVMETDGGQVELVIANNDSMALGAIAALAEKGFNIEGGAREKFIPVVGVDATPQAVDAIKRGIMSATVKQDSDAMGKAVADLLMNALDGKDFLDGTPYKWDESGVAVRIPYTPYSLNTPAAPGSDR